MYFASFAAVSITLYGPTQIGSITSISHTYALPELLDAITTVYRAYFQVPVGEGSSFALPTSAPDDPDETGGLHG
ncbi:hypothetical protein SAMD00023353_5200400 [Rosellinia necatrix]|uniref:Uncharacterized protein n=1 Tax=Rosellinia necatrix TaxID=77044 RepID=A0A1S8A9V4_ROSNE|nr:hypothetical protein SAMD00023353_5200400 [Rosellinia necatrix]